MGTNHAIKVYIDGKLKFAHHGQFDGYPQGQGRDFAGFCSSRDNLERLHRKLKDSRLMTEDELKVISDATETVWRSIERSPLSVDSKYALTKYIANGLEHSRDLGVEVLYRVINAESGAVHMGTADGRGEGNYTIWFRDKHAILSFNFHSTTIEVDAGDFIRKCESDPSFVDRFIEGFQRRVAHDDGEAQ